MDETLKKDTIAFLKNYLIGINAGLKQFKETDMQHWALTYEQKNLTLLLDRWERSK